MSSQCYKPTRTIIFLDDDRRFLIRYDDCGSCFLVVFWVLGVFGMDKSRSRDVKPL